MPRDSVPWAGAALWVVERDRAAPGGGHVLTPIAVYGRHRPAERRAGRLAARARLEDAAQGLLDIIRGIDGGARAPTEHGVRLFNLDEMPDGLLPGAPEGSARYRAARVAHALPARVHVLTCATDDGGEAVLGLYTTRARAIRARRFTDAFCGHDPARTYRITRMRVHRRHWY